MAAIADYGGRCSVEPLLVFPDPPSATLAQALSLASYSWKAVESWPRRRRPNPRTAGRAG